MTAYYNEIDPYAAQWLRNLIKEGLIADGEVDTRSIVDVRPGELVAFKQCHFFAGLGGWAGALRLAGFPDDRAVWTGSCPCQPFSLAGKQKGFADERHLWPVWRELIAERRPAKVYGEQVASAAQWLGLVRGDLEALEYAVGAIPVEAASSGADHLRDRFWFVGDDPSERRREGWAEHAIRGGWSAVAGNGCLEHAPLQRRNGGESAAGSAGWLGSQDASGVGLADADDAGPQGRRVLPERAGERIAGPDGMADAEQRGCEISIDRMGESRATSRRDRCEQTDGPAGLSPAPLEWITGADGKSRRVKSGIRLLAHGVPARVAKLRALGNAIDLRPAATFIRATM